jgi:uncharacterized protein (UPF0332 family)
MENGKFDWSLAVAYNAMLAAGRALMFDRGYRPSSTEGHLAVVRFLQVLLGTEIDDQKITVMNRMRQKRHRIVYEEMDIVTENEAKQCIKWSESFLRKIAQIIHESESQRS